MRIVAALGGNALLERGQKPDASTQIANVAKAVHALAPLAHDHELVLTHGNGPQVGVLALQSASDPNLTTPYPFDVLGAQTQGMIGYWLLQALQNTLPGRQVASIINQTLVLAHDPAFDNPTKFVGEVYDEEQAKRLAEERGWAMRPDGDKWRRVVGSPQPQRVIETRLIRLLLESGAVVVCAGGGGVPVIRDERGKLKGVEAVVDKDLTSSVLATEIGAELLIILTDVPQVYVDYRKPSQRALGAVTIEEIESYQKAGHFASGSMGPKIEAVIAFLRSGGKRAMITNPDSLVDALEGRAGTHFVGKI